MIEKINTVAWCLFLHGEAYITKGYGMKGLFDKNKIIHFIGIGGIGMGSLAEMLIKQGCRVRGSDIASNQVTEQLQSLGAEIYFNHAAIYVRDADIVIYSSAIKMDNVELQHARFLNKNILHRSQLLAALMDNRMGIAIAGTHGKTTTTSMMVEVLNEAGIKPSYAIGGFSQGEQAFSYFGESEFFVAEADESDASFLYLKPQYAIITNIDRDHMEAYDNDFNILKNKFLHFINEIPKEGCVALCVDDPVIMSLLPQINIPYVTFGFSEHAMLRCFDFKQKGLQSHWQVYWNTLALPQLPQLSMALPGRHNVLNAMGVLALALQLKVEPEVFQTALRNFKGIRRRFHIQGEIDCEQGGTALVIDDYGHHPREIQVTMEALRMTWPERRVVLAFQPHRYSRTRELFNDFVAALQDPDVLLLTDIYAAGEVVPETNLSQNLYQAIKSQRSHTQITRFCHDINNLPQCLYEIIQSDDIVLLQGAGSIGRIPDVLTTRFISMHGK